MRPVDGRFDGRLGLGEGLRRKGYRHAVVLGPFAGRDGPPEYTVSLYDSTGRVHLETRRGTARALRDWIADLPEQGSGGGEAAGDEER